MIIVGKFKDISPKDPIGHFRVGLSAEVRMVLRNCMGGIKYDSGWVPNLITDQGLDQLGLLEVGGVLNLYYKVGSGSNAPAITDTQLQTFLGESDTQQGSVVDVNGSAPNYQYSRMVTKRLVAGVATGTIREFAVGPVAGNTQIFNRTAISPAITKASDEVLDISYRLTQWPPLNDLNGTVTIGGVIYDTITRAIDADNAGIPAADVFLWTGWRTPLSVYAKVSDANLVSITANDLSGNVISLSSAGFFTLAYSGGTYRRDTQIDLGLNDGNLGAGIRTARVRIGLGMIQTQFNAQSGGATIPKDATKICSLRWRGSWARR